MPWRSIIERFSCIKCENETKSSDVVLPHPCLKITSHPVSRPVDTVIDFLKNERKHGRTHTFLDNDARASLRELLIRARAAPEITAPVNNAPPTSSESPPKAELILKGSSRSEKLAELSEKSADWLPAKQLGTFRETHVFSEGGTEAKLMLIGDAPGHLDEKFGKPFSGQAGQKLDGILKAMGLSRDQVYLTNLTKFRPAMKRQTTNNRMPTEVEITACLPILFAEIELIEPSVIITLGKTPSTAILTSAGEGSANREQWYSLNGIPLRVSHHPSNLLRSDASNQLKRALWEDMLAVMEKLDLPISAKQKAFFLPKNT